MQVEQSSWTESGKWVAEPVKLGGSAQLLLVFGDRIHLGRLQFLEEIKKSYPRATIIGCSTAGEIIGTRVLDGSVISTAVEFEHTALRTAVAKLPKTEKSYGAGRELAHSLEKDGLVHVFVLSEGININGSELVKGLYENLPEGVTATGGLAGDGEDFKETLVLCDNIIEPNRVVAVGFYSDRLKVGYGSLGGWDPFGPERLITKSSGNVLYEMDGSPALDLYKMYLGEHAKKLPSSGLLFPLTLRTEKDERGVVRTILSVNEEKQSITFAGNVPMGSYARLMKANFNRLVDGAAGAAKTSYEALGSSSPELALLVSCVGRKMVLKQRIEEEVEAVRDILGTGTALAGFYSYGEISPFTPGARCELHNQTMTVTTFLEN
ncbi:MAG: FIST N-terminal domain-containing protein [Thermodesulfobacteriota bacterium]